MNLKNKLFLLLIFFIVFTSYNYNDQKSKFSFFFPIKEIKIKGTHAVSLTKFKTDLDFLRNTSLFFLDKEAIINVSDRYDFISNIQLSKKYPNTLKILVLENIPVATEINGKKRNYLTKEGKKISYTELKVYENLPVIIGNHNNFSSFFYKLKKNNFKINSIKAFYYFEVGRWDVILKDGRTVKLPETNYENIITEVDSLLNNPSFSQYKIFDYRIKDQLILQ